MKLVKSNDFNVVTSFLTSNFSSPTHWPDWNLIVSQHYNTKFFYFLAYEEDQLVGICPIHEEKKKVLTARNSGQHYFIPFGGWIFSEKNSFDFGLFKNTLTLKYALNTLPILEDFNVTYKGESSYRETLVTSLDKPIDDVWTQDVHSKRRNMVRKKSGITIRVDNDVDLFYEHYKSANERYNIGVQPKAFFIDLFQNVKNFKIEVLSAYNEEDECVGMTVLVMDKNYAFYWLGIQIPSRNLGQGDLLQWEAIKRAHENGCKYYDLCHIDEIKLPAIFKFKKGFSNQRMKIATYNQKSYAHKVINKLEKL